MWPRMQSLLDSLKDYAYEKYVLDAACFGLPQRRKRIFIVLLRKDQWPHGTETPFRQINVIVTKQASTTQTLNFPEFLSNHGLPIPKVAAAPNTQQVCHSCHLQAICQQHPCKCKKCLADGPSLRCKWRVTTANFMKSPKIRRERRQYLTVWQGALKKKTLKRAPSYFQLAQTRRLETGSIHSPRQRNMLSAISQTRNIMQSNFIVDLSQDVLWFLHLEGFGILVGRVVVLWVGDVTPEITFFVLIPSCKLDMALPLGLPDPTFPHLGEPTSMAG